MKKLVKDVFIIAVMKSLPDLKRQPLILLVIGLISVIPLFFITIFSQGMIGQGLVGTMISMVAFIGIVAGIQDITWDRYVKIREMIVAMPVHPLSYALGVAIAPLILSLPGINIFRGNRLRDGHINPFVGRMVNSCSAPMLGFDEFYRLFHIHLHAEIFALHVKQHFKHPWNRLDISTAGLLP